MDKGIFKLGDRVFHIEYGWGIVTEINTSYRFGIEVKFDNASFKCGVSYTFDGKEFDSSKQSLLSFTEYTLQGFSQERPIVLPEVGELCLVRNYGGLNWHVAYFLRYDKNEFICSQEHRWDEFKRIKILY